MHTLIIGQTESGKTTLAILIAKGLIERKKNVVVLDPMKNGNWPEGVIHIDEIGQLMTYLKSHQSCYVFIDESGMVVDRYEVEHQWLATTSRHYGHSVYFIAQRAQMLHPTVRDQCQCVYAFLISPKDSDILADRFIKMEKHVRKACYLNKGEFIVCTMYGKPMKGVLDFSTMKVDMKESTLENVENKKRKQGANKS